MTKAYIYSFMTVLEPGNSRLAALCLNHSDTLFSMVQRTENIFKRTEDMVKRMEDMVKRTVAMVKRTKL